MRLEHLWVLLGADEVSVLITSSLLSNSASILVDSLVEVSGETLHPVPLQLVHPVPLLLHDDLLVLGGKRPVVGTRDEHAAANVVLGLRRRRDHSKR